MQAAARKSLPCKVRIRPESRSTPILSGLMFHLKNQLKGIGLTHSEPFPKL
jgi:hypothetical protein